jgi:hypothetical protein
MFARQPKDLVDGPRDLITGERRDYALDLPPMAETHDIAVVAAALGARRRLEPGIIAVAGDQFRGIGQRNAAVDEWLVHAALFSGTVFPDCGRSSSTTREPYCLAFEPRLGMAASMPSSTRAGGCFLTLFLLLGFVYGLSIRNPLKGVLIGLGIGTVLAIATWLIDRQRRR